MMSSITGKTIFRLLPIVTMVILHVATSYAMASMDHSQHQDLVSAEQQSRGGHHAMSEDVSDIQHQNDDDSAETLNDFCNGTVCCPAIVGNIDKMLHTPNSMFFVSLHLSWEGIDLPAEIKPPQSLLG